MLVPYHEQEACIKYLRPSLHFYGYLTVCYKINFSSKVSNDLAINASSEYFMIVGLFIDRTVITNIQLNLLSNN